MLLKTSNLIYDIHEVEYQKNFWDSLGWSLICGLSLTIPGQGERKISNVENTWNFCMLADENSFLNMRSFILWECFIVGIAIYFNMQYKFWILIS